MNSASKTAPCPDCNGQGRNARDPETGYKRGCDRCKGSGEVIVREMAQVPISRKAPDRRRGKTDSGDYRQGPVAAEEAAALKRKGPEARGP
jgi:DnaJ-class molecular chaperone